jgi:hypothetical protein
MMKSREMRLAGHVARIGANRNAYRDFVGKSEEKRPLGRPRRMCVYNIKIDHREGEDAVVLTGWIWLGIGTSGGLL